MKIFFSEKLKLLSFLLIFCLLFPSCSRGGADIELLFSDFDAEISIRKNRELFVASVSVDALSEGCRNATLRFSAPECMSGLCVTLHKGTGELSLNGTPLGEPPAEYLRILALLSPVGAFERLCESGSDICYSSGGARWYFDAESRLPRVIESEDIKIEILKIGQQQK